MPPAKPVLRPLKTPQNTSFPSEIHSASLSAVSDVKREDSMTTPITPPVAYTEFLKSLTPVFTSPVSPEHSFSKFSFEKRSPEASQPQTATVSSSTSEEPLQSVAPPQKSATDPLPHASKCAKERRRLRISPTKASSKNFSPTASATSPKSATTPWSPYSPADWKLRYFEAPHTSGGSPVSVRQVVTRTVTYTRTPLDPPPKGKRRKTTEV
ncbi:hypothetical protein VTN31DRAFT_2908 [Thermomyces dupontii]|uniref:uncharacterized protein n=1 Tax=Talaromyces thermophilus TaxID=28565 RepID=UPI003742F117